MNQRSCFKNIEVTIFEIKLKNIALVPSLKNFENDPKHANHDEKMKIPKVDQNQSGKVPEGSGHQEQ
jgi:ABC-type proline/glycine betaine transport system ATPase subunit